MGRLILVMFAVKDPNCSFSISLQVFILELLSGEFLCKGTEDLGP